MAQDVAIRLTGKDDTGNAFSSVSSKLGGLKTASMGTTDSLGSLAGTAKLLGGAFAGLASINTVVDISTKLVGVQREFDRLNASLITVTGSSSAADGAFDWLQKFAANTPYQLNEVTGAFIKMKALGLDASERSLSSYGNTASAMGKGLNQMIEAVADAATGEFERLKEFGIKAKQNGDQVSLTFQGVTTTIGNNAAEITKYLQQIGEVEFGGAMEQRMKTLDGAISNLADNWEGLLRTVNQGGFANAVGNDVSTLNNELSGLTETLKNSQAAGDGMFKQFANATGFVIGTAAIGTLNTTANALNGTINFLTGNLLDLNTQVNLMPQSLMSSSQQSASLARELSAAEADLARLQAKLAESGGGFYLRAETEWAQKLVNELRAAKKAKDDLAGGSGAGGGRGSVNPMTVEQMQTRDDKNYADVSALKFKQSGVPADYIKQVNEIIRLDQAGALAAGDFTDMMNKAHSLLKVDKTGSAGIKKAYQESTALLSAQIDAIKNAGEIELGVLANKEKMIEALHSAGLLDARSYYTNKSELLAQSNAAQEDALQKEIARLQSENLTGKDKIDNDKKIAAAQADLIKVRQAAATSQGVLSIQESAALKAVSQAYRDAEDAAQSYLDTIRLTQSRDLSGMGRGDKERSRTSGRAQIEDKYSQQTQDLNKSRRDAELNGTFGPDAQAKYDEELDRIKRFSATALAEYDAYFAKRTEQEGNWAIGANEALSNYLSESSNIASQSQQAFASAFQNMEDALVNFVTTGKLSFSSLATSVIADLTRILIKQQMVSAASAFMGAGGFSGLLGSAIGAISGTAGQAAVASAMPGNSLDNLLSLTGGFGTFEGGGSTGNGPRVGGLDGKGGYLAMVHPQETVVDHAKGQSISPQTQMFNVTYNIAAGTSADDFRRSQKQVEAGLARTVRRALA